MSLEGTIVGGHVEFDAPTGLPEGTRVRVETIAIESTPTNNDQVSAWLATARKEREAKPLSDLNKALLALSGKIKGLPPDFATQHDHYIHGTAKR